MMGKLTDSSNTSLAMKNPISATLHIRPTKRKRSVYTLMIVLKGPTQENNNVNVVRSVICRTMVIVIFSESVMKSFTAKILRLNFR